MKPELSKTIKATWFKRDYWDEKGVMNQINETNVTISGSNNLSGWLPICIWIGSNRIGCSCCIIQIPRCGFFGGSARSQVETVLEGTRWIQFSKGQKGEMLALHSLFLNTSGSCVCINKMKKIYVFLENTFYL